MNDALRYKLRTMGVPLKRASRVICDNQSVFISNSFPESTLKRIIPLLLIIESESVLQPVKFYYILKELDQILLTCLHRS